MNPLEYKFIGPDRILHPDGREFVVDDLNEIWMDLKAKLDAGDPSVSIDEWVEPPPTLDQEMAQADQAMRSSRVVEDVIDACIAVLGPEFRNTLSANTVAIYDNKKAVRSRRPA